MKQDAHFVLVVLLSFYIFSLRIKENKSMVILHVLTFVLWLLLQVLLITRFLQHEHHLSRPINQVSISLSTSHVVLYSVDFSLINDILHLFYVL